MTVNFDNAATTFPKPESVRRALSEAVSRYGGNAGRGGHRLTLATSEKVFDTRQTAADFFGAVPENVVFTLNCTHALNFAIQGIMKSGGHIIISSIEHNSVARPVYALSENGNVFYSIAPVYDDDEQFLGGLKRLIRHDTKAIVCTIAGNVTGRILPFREIAQICRSRNICFIADGAQACGILDVKLSDGINILCTSGHKGLYGPAGTGLLISDGEYGISPVIQGGTGSSSMNLIQPDFLPDSLESGTVNTTGIIALKSGIDFVRKMGTDKIYAHENRLCRKFISLLDPDRVTVYRTEGLKYAPVVSFNINGMPPEEAAGLLSDRGYCLRAGLHCSPLAHKTLGTDEGTVRFAPSVFNNENQVYGLTKEIKKLCENL
ncbi:MAG: aminotransferase class V-fold PLP-dependent enzyme [Oscillospiraceae bacterium]|nr:aminotransferase class V-fold PLP-dependent enzyme [Oscillospiraceae bacterium]